MTKPASGRLVKMISAFQNEVASLIDSLRQHARQMGQTSGSLTILVGSRSP